MNTSDDTPQANDGSADAPHGGDAGAGPSPGPGPAAQASLQHPLQKCTKCGALKPLSEFGFIYGRFNKQCSVCRARDKSYKEKVGAPPPTADIVTG